MLERVKDPEAFEATLDDPLPWEVEKRTNTVMSQSDMSAWGSMIGSGPG